MGDDSVYAKGLVYDSSLPSAADNDDWRGLRLNRYNEPVIEPANAWRYRAAREGTLFYAHNPTNDASTTIAGHAAPVLADADATMTKPLIFARMADAATVNAELDFIIIEVVTAGATGDQACWAMQLDSGATRVTTAGTALTTVNPNMNSSASASLAVSAGAIVVSAETAAVRHFAHGTHRPSIEVAGDKYMFVFGRDPELPPTVAAGSVRNFVTNLPPVILGATDCLLLALHSQASQNAAGVYKIQVQWRER